MLLISGYLFLQVRSLTKQLTSMQVQPTPLVSPKPSAEAETADWKTFIGTNYAIKYPSDWYTRSVESSTIISSYVELSQPVPNVRAKIEIFNYDNPKKLSSKEWVADLNSKRQDPDNSVEAQSITIDGIQAYVRVDNSLSNENTIIYLVYLQKNDKMYSFWAGGNKKYEQVLFQILSTFRFLDNGN